MMLCYCDGVTVLKALGGDERLKASMCAQTHEYTQSLTIAAGNCWPRWKQATQVPIYAQTHKCIESLITIPAQGRLERLESFVYAQTHEYIESLTTAPGNWCHEWN